MTLIIETCTERGLVAFAQNGVLIAKEELPFGYHNAKSLMPAIDRILGTTKPEAIVVGVGPGSYTGIRMGAVVAKTFSFVWNIPIYTVSTLEAFAQPDAAVIIDAKISGSYLLLPNGEPQVCSLENLETQLKNISKLITPFAGRLRSKVEALYPQATWEWVEQAPDPMRMLHAAKQNGPLKHDQLELLYLRKTQAEIEQLECKKPNVVSS